MINFDNCTNENKIEHNLKRPYIPDTHCWWFRIRKKKWITEFNKQSARY